MRLMRCFVLYQVSNESDIISLTIEISLIVPISHRMLNAHYATKFSKKVVVYLKPKDHHIKHYYYPVCLYPPKSILSPAFH